MSREEEILQSLIDHARSLFERNYTCSTGGNLSHRYQDGFFISATNTSIGRLAIGDFVYCTPDGRPGPGEALHPSKEVGFHAAIFRARPEVNAIVHLHAPACIALAGMAEPTLEGNVLPVVTPGAIARVGRLPLLEYIKPGAPALAERIDQICTGVNAILLQNHGIVAYAPKLAQAVDILEEAEQNIRVWLMSMGTARVLTDEEMAAETPLFGAVVPPGQQQPRLRPQVAGWLVGLP